MKKRVKSQWSAGIKDPSLALGEEMYFFLYIPEACIFPVSFIFYLNNLKQKMLFHDDEIARCCSDGNWYMVVVATIII